jgi:hypothetical protein
VNLRLLSLCMLVLCGAIETSMLEGRWFLKCCFKLWVAFVTLSYFKSNLQVVIYLWYGFFKILHGNLTRNMLPLFFSKHWAKSLCLQLGSRCRELKDIHFGQCYKISDEGMIVIAKSCLKLQRIYMQENKLVSTCFCQCCSVCSFPPSEFPLLCLQVVSWLSSGKHYSLKRRSSPVVL